jgi:hypothetical protein
MRTFLGVPVMARGRVYGNLYLTEKHGGEDFDVEDERALTLLAAQAGAAIEAAQLFEEANDRAQRLEAIRAISTAILAGTEPGDLLGLIAGHGRALVGADLATVVLPLDDQRLVVEAAEGMAADALRGTEFPAEGSVTGEVMRTGKVVVLADDGAIQSLFAVGMGLQGSALLASDSELRDRIQHAVEELDRVIRDLRNYIFGLRPGILADRQLDQALQGLVEEFRRRTGVVAVAEVDPAVAADLGRPGRDRQHPRPGHPGPGDDSQLSRPAARYPGRSGGGRRQAGGGRRILGTVVPPGISCG